MKKLLVLFLLSVSFQGFSQDFDTINAEIMEEATKLYELQVIALKGADLYLKKYKNRDNIGGYISYKQDSLSKFIFYSKAKNAKVIAEITLDASHNLTETGIDVTERNFNAYETDLYEIRSKSEKRIRTDKLFKTYNNIQLKILPLIYKGKKKAYIVTGPKKTGMAVFGNDYRIDFDKDNKIVGVKRLHAEVTPIEYQNDNKEYNAIHIHTKYAGDAMTVTDVFTLLMHWKYANWETHMVVSKDYLSVLHLRSKRLISMTKEAYEKMIERIDKAKEKQKQKAQKTKS